MSSKLRAVAACGAAAVFLAFGARLDAQDGIPGLATDVGNRFINLNTPLVNDSGTFEVVITHRFNQSVKDASGSSLWGLDGSAEIGLGVEYTPVNRVAVQVFRGRTHADYEFASKIALLRPKKDLPFAVAVRGGVNWLTGSDLAADAGLAKQTSGFGQLLVSGTFFDRVTLAAAPTYVQRSPVQRDIRNVPVMAQVKLTKSVALMAEFIPKLKPDLKTSAVDLATGAISFVDVAPVYQWSVLIEKSVFHHRFGLYVGNTVGSTIDQLMGGDFGASRPVDPGSGTRVIAGGVTDKNIHFGFNIIRNFDIPPK
jgi:hypothetical protein